MADGRETNRSQVFTQISLVKDTRNSIPKMFQACFSLIAFPKKGCVQL